MLYGYAPNILEVDLSSRQITKVPTDPDFMRQWIGGMGLATKILYDRVGPKVDALSPENLLIFSAGPAAGTLIPRSGRVEVIAKSPLTGMWGAANTGAHWGPALRYAGYEAIIISGKASGPVYLYIDNDRVEIRDASHLWGLDTWEATDWLKAHGADAYPDKNMVACIGPAGENLVRFASITVDYQRSASRSGVGTVMGSKKLKAIVVRGDGTIPVARPQKLIEQALAYVRKGDPWIMGRRDLPPAYLVSRALNHPRLREPGTQPGKNWQVTLLPNWDRRTVKYSRQYVRAVGESCHACHVSDACIEVKTGKYAGVKLADGHMQPIQSFGAICAIEDIAAIFRCQELSEQLGMDYIEAGAGVGFALELSQRGLLPEEMTGGLNLEWGNEDTVLKLLGMIAYRQGIGDLLAEGTDRAAKRLGKETARYSMTVRGMVPDIVEQQRVGTTVINLGPLSSPRGGCNVRTSHMYYGIEEVPSIRPPGCEKMTEEEFAQWWIEHLDIFPDIKEKIYGKPPRMGPFTPEQQALMWKWCDETMTLCNILELCLARDITPHIEMFNSLTGWDMTPQEMMKTAEKVFNLAWAYNAREGVTRRDMDFPERFYKEPIPDGPHAGAVLSREEVDKLRDAYFEVRGWDKKKGIPSAAKLRELGLDFAAKELEEMGVYG